MIQIGILTGENHSFFQYIEIHYLINLLNNHVSTTYKTKIKKCLRKKKEIINQKHQQLTNIKLQKKNPNYFWLSSKKLIFN